MGRSVNPDSTTAPRLLRITDVMERTALSRSYIYARIKSGDFPPAIRLGHRCARWASDQIDAWLRAKLSG